MPGLPLAQHVHAMAVVSMAASRKPHDDECLLKHLLFSWKYMAMRTACSTGCWWG